MTDASTPAQDELEALFVNNADLDQIAAYLNRFNPIRVMRMEGVEVRHSNILAWLMDPNETHGFGDRFLRAFLSEALRGASDGSKPTALQIAQADLRDVEIRREWQHIDIFVLSPRNGWAFIIENKYYSSQHGGQLARYAEKVRAAFDTRDEPLAIRGIFLALNEDEDPEDKTYRTIYYSTLVEFMPTLLQRQGQTTGPEVRAFLLHYIEILKEVTGMSEDLADMQKLARELYRTHRRVLDFIQKHGSTTDFSFALADVFGDTWEDDDVISLEDNKYRNIWHNGSLLNFLPEGWYEALGGDVDSWPGCEKYGAGHPVVCWIELRPDADGTGGIIYLQAEVGPLADHKARKALIEAIQEAGLEDTALGQRIGFRREAAKEGTKYSRFIKQKRTKVSDVQDPEEIRRELKKLFKDNRLVFEALAPVLGEFATEYGPDHE